MHTYFVLMHTFSAYLSVQGTKDDSALAASRLPSCSPVRLVSLALLQCPVAKLLATYVLLSQYYGNTEAADWPYWMTMTVLESRNVDSNKYTQMFHTVAVSLLHAL